MSSLSNEDGDLHYSDNSHRWIAPLGVAQATWEGMVRAHLEAHRAGLEAVSPQQAGREAAARERSQRARSSMASRPQAAKKAAPRRPGRSQDGEAP